MLGSRLQAIGTISLLAMVSLLLPPLAYIMSGVPTSLITLRKGPAYGLQVIIGAILVTSFLAYFANLGIATGLSFGLGVWSPVWLCSIVMRVTESQSITVLVAGSLGVVFVSIMRFFVVDITVKWQMLLDEWFDNSFTTDGADQVRAIFDAALPLMNAIMASALVVSIIITVLLSRWWQSILFNPGGFRIEFYRLRLPRLLTILVFICLIVSKVDLEGIKWFGSDVLIICIFLFLFQGISSVHRIVFARKMSRGWLVAMYCFLVIIPQMVLFLSCLGMADSWIGGNKTQSGDAA